MNVRSWLHNRRGEWFVVIQFVIMAAIVLAPHSDKATDSSGIAVVAGTALCVVGVAVSLIAVLGLGKNLTAYPKPKNDGELVERGLYSIVRHPIYSGLILFAMGWSLAWQSWLAFAMSILLFLFFDFKARREEAWLAEKYVGYASYKERVRKLVPFIY